MSGIDFENSRIVFIDLLLIIRVGISVLQMSVSE